MKNILEKITKNEAPLPIIPIVISETRQIRNAHQPKAPITSSTFKTNYNGELQ